MIATAPSCRVRQQASAADQRRAGEDVAFYVGTMTHSRRIPKVHAFSARLFFVLVDVDALPGSLDGFPLWSAKRRSIMRFRRRDYFDGTDLPLGDGVRALVEDRTGSRPAGPVRLLTQVRTAGWVFNPLSIYFCFSADGDRVEAIVLEVTNTPWKERCWYVVPVTADNPHGPWDFPKVMHVSPFLSMDLMYRLRCSGPADRLTVHLEDRHDGSTIFAASLDLHRVAFSRRTAVSVPLRHPLLTWRVSVAIHTHAIRLWRKGVPIHRHVSGPCEHQGVSAS